jgi:hypothetical protein
LKLEKLGPPARVTLGAWPNEKLRVLARSAGGPATLWDVPVLPMKALDLNDSAIVIYWEEQPLKPDERREVGFEYGLWSLASQGSRLAATVAGVFRPDGEKSDALGPGQGNVSADRTAMIHARGRCVHSVFANSSARRSRALLIARISSSLPPLSE